MMVMVVMMVVPPEERPLPTPEIAMMMVMVAAPHIELNKLSVLVASALRPRRVVSLEGL